MAKDLGLALNVYRCVYVYASLQGLLLALGVCVIWDFQL
jgi:hypothetical protein